MTFFTFHSPGMSNPKPDGMKRWEWQRLLRRMEKCGYLLE